jgi:hypothetical protein
MNPEILIIGNRGGSNVGESFFRACELAGIPAAQIEPCEAMDAPVWIRRAFWLVDRRPVRMNEFAAKVLAYCEANRPRLLLCIGFAPLPRIVLERIGARGICRAVYLTDDPWNPAHRSRWFQKALAGYDHVFSARRANLSDCESAGAKRVSYLPFGYDPAICSPANWLHAEGEKTFDVLFAGGADGARVPYISALVNAGCEVGLFGSYWDRFAETRLLTRGQVPVTEIPSLVSRSRIALCLVRQANRDDVSMRSFELPAMGACLLLEHTDEHVRLFGTDGQSALFFRSIAEMVTKARMLLADPALRARLASAASRRIQHGNHTYSDRLFMILETTGFRSAFRRQACPA